MRYLIGLTLFATLAAQPARAEEWCGFQDAAHSRVKCGYSSLAECQQMEKQRAGICMPDPSFASLRGHRSAGQPG
jgi:hypothetical protein